MPSFRFYSSGIYSDPNCNGNNINHAITVIGYGVNGESNEYFHIKNSWGNSWGLDGFGYIARNQGNMCGIASYGSYPVEFNSHQQLSDTTANTEIETSPQ